MATKISTLVTCFVNQLQSVENAASAFFSAFNIHTATAAQLDLIGEWLGESRLGLTDAEFRQVLYFKISQNRSTGSAEFLIETLLFATDTPWVELIEVFPAKIRVKTNATVFSPEAISRTKKIVAGGVGLTVINAYNTPFVFDTDSATYPSPTPPTFGFGFDELNTLPHTGGKLSELII